MTDSASAGFLQPAPSPAPLEGQDLLNFVQAWIVGITGLDGTLVVPWAQPEPPNLPNAGTVFCAFSIRTRTADTYPWIGRTVPDDGADHLQRHQDLDILLTFYDLGSGGQADAMSALFRDGSAIPQNLEVLSQNNMGLVKVGQAVDVPVLVKTRWQYRVDLPVVIRREVLRTYPVLTVESAEGTIVTSDGYTAPFQAPPT